MAAPAALSANYADLKLIKTRSVAQIVLEIDISRAEEFIKAFGIPQPGKEQPVAIALLDPAVASEKPADPQKSQAAKDRYRALPEWAKAAQRAAILCGERGFQKWAATKPFPGMVGRYDVGYESRASEQFAVEFVRIWCKVKSRSEIATDERAYKAFLALEADYRQSVGQMAEAR